MWRTGCRKEVGVERRRQGRRLHLVLEEDVRLVERLTSDLLRPARELLGRVIEPAQAQGSLVELAGEGRRVLIGRHVRPEHRAVLAQELRRALRRAQAGLPPLDTQESELEPQR